MRKRKLKLFAGLMSVLLLMLSFCPVNSIAADGGAGGQTQNEIERLQGKNRYGTMLAIAQTYYDQQVNTIVLATGRGFADALAGVVLAHQKKAPILLVDRSPELSRDVLAYIQDHLIPGGTVYILGGNQAVADSFIVSLEDMGITDIRRLGGADRYETAVIIARELNHDGNMYYLVSGENFPDALGASVLAATENNGAGENPAGVPIILIPSDGTIPQAVMDYFQSLIGPGQGKTSLKVVGGEASIPEASLRALQSFVPWIAAGNISRFAGNNRYETMSTLYTDHHERFNAAWRSLNGTTANPMIFLASGEDYADALVGAVLAAKYQAPLVFVSQDLPSAVRTLLQSFKEKSPKDRFHLIVLGGPMAVSEQSLRAAADLLSKPDPASGSGSGGSSGTGGGDSGGSNPGGSDPGGSNPGGGDPGSGDPGSGGPGSGDPDPPGTVEILTALPSPGSAVGSTQIALLPALPDKATKFQIKVQNTPFATPEYDSPFGGTDYTAGQDITAAAGQYLVLAAVDDAGRLKGYFTAALTAVMIKPPKLDVKASAISAGHDHSLALRENETVIAWGSNLAGQLGNGVSSFGDYSPGDVLELTGIQAVAAGKEHSLALKDDGTVWGWGTNYNGELMDNDYEVFTPVKLSGLENIAAIAAGAYFSIALKQDGTVWAWGSNEYGNLGNGLNQDSQVPVQVTGLNNIVAIAAGEDHALAVKDDGTVWAWGNNSFKQLGKTGVGAESHTAVQVQNLTNVQAVDAGYAHSMALKTDGSVWCWGANYSYQLGMGVKGNYADPMQVTGVAGVLEIAAGWEFSLARTTEGVYSWGDNNYGQLGNAQDRTSEHLPVQVQGLSNVLGISAGGSHSLALDSGGRMWAWGRNNLGQLGTNGDNSNVPVQVGVPNSIITPKAVNFDKYDPGQGDVEVTLTLNGNELISVHEGTVPLQAGQDYTVTATSLIIKKSYLQAKSLGKIQLTIDFSAGSKQTLEVDIIGEPGFEAPVIENVSAVEADMKLQFDLPGTVYWAVLPAQAAVPTAEQLIGRTIEHVNGQCAYNPESPAQTVRIGNLAPRTEYIVYALLVDSDHVNSAVKASAVFATGLPKNYLFYADFTQSNGGFTAGVPAGREIPSSWEWGSPIDPLDGDGSQGWGTNLNGNYANNEISYLDSPPIDMSGISSSDHITISWKHWHQFDSQVYDGKFDVANVFYSLNGGKDWTAFSSGHTGSTGRWMTVGRTDLTGMKANDFRIRFEFRSNAAKTDLGWYIQDLVIFKWPDDSES